MIPAVPVTDQNTAGRVGAVGGVPCQVRRSRRRPITTATVSVASAPTALLGMSETVHQGTS